MTFGERLSRAARANSSLVCVGLDPDPQLMPVKDVLAFNKAIIDATQDLVCAYKPNLAFYEALGLEGWRALAGTVAHVGGKVPVIADAKRGDIGNTAKAYARALFETLGFDASTVNPYLGRDAMEPFLEYADKGIIILCRTSNPGSADFQSLTVTNGQGQGRPLFEVVAQKATEWDQKRNVGLVVGATFPQELKRVRELCPDMPILIPGVGAQGGDLEASVRWGCDSRGEGAIINSSRAILYASKGPDFAEAARKATLDLREAINAHRQSPGSLPSGRPGPASKG